MRNGHRVFDADAHVWEPPDLLEAHIDPSHREALRSRNDGRYRSIAPNPIQFGRLLGSEEPASTKANVQFRGREPHPDSSRDPALRIADMDLEGIDASIVVPSGVGSFCSVEVDLELAVHRAYHRYMAEYCSPYPGRLCGVAMVSARALDDSLVELRRVGAERWCVGVFPAVPRDMPLDSPKLEPLWAAANELDLTVVLHTFTFTPPYSPGALDGSFFDNAWIARSAAHPWAGMRNIASLLGSGVLDRHQSLRVALLEAGQGWLPYWVHRLEEQAEYMAGALPAGVAPFSEYIRSGRYFQSIELHEGERLTKQVIDELGQDLLMFSTDYPHGESWFPRATEAFFEWDLTEDVRRKLLWENALTCFRRFDP